MYRIGKRVEQAMKMGRVQVLLLEEVEHVVVSNQYDL